MTSSFTDTLSSITANNLYMVRAVKAETSAPGGQCVLDITQDITNGTNRIVNSGKHLLIPGNLTIQ